MNLTKEEILNKINTLKDSYNGFDYSLSREDGYTMISVWGEGINPKIFDILSQQIADLTHTEFYFSNATSDALQGFINANFNKVENNQIPEKHDPGIKQYGQEFIPKIATKKLKI